MKIPKFILIQSLVTVALFIAGYLSLSQSFDPNSRLWICLAIWLSSVAGAVSYVITYAGMEKSIRAFSTYLIGGMVFKMFFAIISLSVFSITMNPLAIPFVLAYFFSYIIFISFEIYALLRKLRPDLKKTSTEVHENQ